MKNKKIFFVADAKSIHVVKWVDYFVDKQYEVYLATFSSINNTKCKNVFFLSEKISNIGGGNYHYLFSIKKLSKLFDEIRPDIINAHYSYSMGFVSLLAKKKAKIQAEFSIVCHGSDILAPPSPIVFDIINKYVINNCDKVFAVSDQIKDKILNFGVNINKVFVGQYGINTKEIKSVKKDIDILSNRNYTSNSRIELLLDAIKSFKEQKLNIVFVLPHIDQQKLEIFKKRYPFIEFYTQLPYEKMMEVISRSKLYVSATKSDGTSLSLLEAMHMRAIPVVSNIVSNRSWVLDGVNGYLFDTQEQLVKKIEQALYEDRENMIKLNQHIVVEKASYFTQMQKIEEFLIQ